MVQFYWTISRDNRTIWLLHMPTLRESKGPLTYEYIMYLLSLSDVLVSISSAIDKFIHRIFINSKLPDSFQDALPTSLACPERCQLDGSCSHSCKVEQQ